MARVTSKLALSDRSVRRLDVMEIRSAITRGPIHRTRSKLPTGLQGFTRQRQPLRTNASSGGPAHREGTKWAKPVLSVRSAAVCEAALLAVLVLADGAAYHYERNCGQMHEAESLP